MRWRETVLRMWVTIALTCAIEVLASAIPASSQCPVLGKSCRFDHYEACTYPATNCSGCTANTCYYFCNGIYTWFQGSCCWCTKPQTGRQAISSHPMVPRAGAVILTALSPNGQFTPVVAKMRQTTQVTHSDKSVKTQVKEGYYYRSSDGSVLEHWVSLNGVKNDLLQGSSLLDNRNGTSYVLDYRNRRAIFDAKLSPISPELDPQNLKAVESQPEEVIQGVRCRVTPAQYQAEGKVIGGGKSWYSVENVLLVKSDVSYPLGNDDTVHATFELYDIDLGQEPDPDLFDIAKNFQVLMPQDRN